MKKNISATLLTVSLFIITSKMAFATDYHLTPDDDWFQMLSETNLQPGDKVILANGTYSDSRRLSISHQGTEQAPIIIRSENPGGAVLTRPNAQQNTINIEGAQHLVLQGLEITGGSIGIRITSKMIDGTKHQAEFISIKECHIHHTGDAAVAANIPGDTNNGHKFLSNEIHHTGGSGEGFYLGSNNDKRKSTTSVFKNGLIEGNYIHHLDGPTISQGDGIEIKDGSYNNRVLNNVIHNTNYPGILVYGTDGNAPNIIEGNIIWSSGDNGIQAASEAVISNNIILSPGGSGIHSQNHQSAIPGSIKIIHNTIITNGSSTAINIGHPTRATLSGPVVIANNALYVIDTGLALRLQNLPGFTVIGNIGVGEVQPLRFFNDLAWNPNGNLDLDFVNWRNKDVFPATGSLLIGKAYANITTANDFNKTKRNNSLDVGAYIYKPEGNPGWKIRRGFKISPRTSLDSDGDGIEDVQDNCINDANTNQRDTDKNGYGNLCDGDLNNDGSVSFTDLDLLRASFGTDDPDADFDGNGSVSFTDLEIFRKLFGKATGSEKITE